MENLISFTLLLFSQVVHTFLTSDDKSCSVPHWEKSAFLVSLPSYSYRTSLMLTQHPYFKLKTETLFQVKWVTLLTLL